MQVKDRRRIYSTESRITSKDGEVVVEEEEQEEKAGLEGRLGWYAATRSNPCAPTL